MKNNAHAFDLNTSPMHLLHRVRQSYDLAFQTQVQDPTVTARQYALLWAISQQPGRNQSDLVAQTGIDRSTMTDMVRRLEKRGLIRRQRMRSDARAWAVKLSEEGQKTLKVAEAAAKKVDAMMHKALPERDTKALIEHLDRIVEALRASAQNPRG